MTTTLNITDTQIRQLADDAGWHADYAMAAICDIAVTGRVDPRRKRLMDADQRAIVAQFRSRSAARAECARVLAEHAAL